MVPAIPSTDYMLKMFPDALIIALVVYSLGVSMVKIFSMKENYEIDGNQVMHNYTG